MYKNFIKSFLDYLFSYTVFIVILPFFLLLTCLLYFFNKGGVFFTQDRPGKHGKVFKLIKFKTMTDERDANGKLLPDDQRITSVGKFIRSTSLDEIPQLINVMKGDMSVIGPRPLLVSYLKLYTERQSRRHEVKPGITGWAQVNGRNSISWEDKFELDVWYVDHLSFLLDLKIFWLTIKKVIVREGINMQGSVTTTPFKGNKEQE